MFTNRKRIFIAMILPFVLLGFSAAACNIPFLPVSTTAPDVTGTPGATKTAKTVKPTKPAKTPGIPVTILTEVAATIHARLTDEAPVVPTTAISPPDITMPEPPQAPYPAPITMTPTKTLTHQVPSAPIHTNTPTPTSTYTPTPSRTKFSLPYTPKVLGPGTGGYTAYGFKVKGFNIHWCGGVPWAIFLVNNRDSHALESLVLHLYDASTNQTLSGPVASDAPFMATDKTCVFGGIGSLAPGGSRYIGNSLGWVGLKGHTIQATITLCTENGLGGTCHQKTVEFVAP